MTISNDTTIITVVREHSAARPVMLGVVMRTNGVIFNRLVPLSHQLYHPPPLHIAHVTLFNIMDKHHGFNKPRNWIQDPEFGAAEVKPAKNKVLTK